IGCHLVLVGGRAVLPPHHPLPPSVPALLAAIAARRIHIREELAAQVRKILKAGLKPTHLDTHKHTHMAPPVLDAVFPVAEEFGVRWVRRPFDLPITAATGEASWLQRRASRAMAFLRGRFERALARHHCSATDHFAGFQLTGHLRTEELVRLIRA